ncbi:MAG: hypothetical protein OEW17_10300 [Gemmatimonadota bacterium]|nr:hypothetical protein [Gemmatimonadota bacterium]
MLGCVDIGDSDELGEGQRRQSPCSPSVAAHGWSKSAQVERCHNRQVALRWGSALVIGLASGALPGCGAQMVDEWRAELRPVCEPLTSATPVDPAGLPPELDHFCGFLEPVPGECEIGGSPMVGEVDGDQFVLTYRGPDSELASGQSDLDCSTALAVYAKEPYETIGKKLVLAGAEVTKSFDG